MYTGYMKAIIRNTSLMHFNAKVSLVSLQNYDVNCTISVLYCLVMIITLERE